VNGRLDPSEKVLRAVGVKRVVMYKLIKEP
jgi:hypothetical protein